MFEKIIKNKFIIVFIFIVTAFVVYFNVLNGEFQFDDYPYFVENNQVHDISTFLEWPRYMKQRVVGMLTFYYNYQLHGTDNPFGWHVTNVIIHILVTCSIWQFIQLLFQTPAGESSKLRKYSDFIAFSTALLFLTHPIQTQAVSYITQRLASLATFFYISSLCFYLLGRIKLESRKYGRDHFISAFIFGVLGMFTKENVATLPLMVITIEMMFFQHETKLTNLLKKIKWNYLLPIIILLAVIPAFYSFNLHHIFGVNTPSYSSEGEMVTDFRYLLTQFRVVSTYIKLLVLPIGQNFDYDYSVSQHLFDGTTFWCFLFLFSVIVYAFYVRKKNVFVSFGSIWFFLTGAVENSVIPIRHVIFEHRAYMPSLGFFLVLVSFLMSQEQRNKLMIVIIISLSGIYSALTIRRNIVWQTQIGFWQDVLKKSPEKSRGYDNLASVYIQKNEFQQAEKYLLKALEINPNNLETHNNLGLIYSKKQMFDEALYQYDLALADDNLISTHSSMEKAKVFNNRGLLHMKLENNKKAEDDFIHAIQYNQQMMEAPMNLGLLYEKQGENQEALTIFTTVDHRFRNNVIVKIQLLRMYLKLNMKQDVDNILGDLFRLAHHAAQLNEIGKLLTQYHYEKMAAVFYQQSLRMDTQNRQAYVELGKIYGNADQFDEAISIWTKGLQVFKNDSEMNQLINQARQIRKNLN